MSLMKDGEKGNLICFLTYEVWEGDEAKRLLLTFLLFFFSLDLETVRRKAW